MLISNTLLSLHDRSIRSQVLCEVRDGVARDLHGARRPRVARGELRENACRVVDKIGLESSLLDLFLREISRELVDDRADHLQMPQLLCADIGQQALELGVGHGVALGEVAQRRAELAVRAAVLRDDRCGKPWIRVLDLDGVL